LPAPSLLDAEPGTPVVDEPVVGWGYRGKVIKVTEFCAFVELLPDVVGLLHVSEVSDPRPNKIEDELRLNDEISVKVLGMTATG
jgi:polyribonucleotide nucleotidyltransferase